MTAQKAEKGMRIHVFSSDSSEDLGIGTIIDVVDLVDDDTGSVISENFPIIQLDSGKEITGLDCWWSPVEEMKNQTVE